LHRLSKLVNFIQLDLKTEKRWWLVEYLLDQLNAGCFKAELLL